MIEHKTSRKDRRRMDVKITRSGLDLLSEMAGCEQQIDNVLSKLPNKEVGLLNDILDKIK